MRIFICLAVTAFMASVSQAAVVTTQASSTGSVNSFTSNNLASTGGTGNVNLPATASLASNVAPADPFIDMTNSITVNTVDSFNGLDVNRWTWTVTSATQVSKMIFTFAPISPLASGFRLVQPTGLAPAGWIFHQGSAGALEFTPLATQFVAAGSYAFVFDIDARDVNIPAVQPPGVGSFTVGLIAQNPEPGSLALCGLALSMGGGAAWRRRRKQKASVSDESDKLTLEN